MRNPMVMGSKSMPMLLPGTRSTSTKNSPAAWAESALLPRLEAEDTASARGLDAFAPPCVEDGMPPRLDCMLGREVGVPGDDARDSASRATGLIDGAPA
mmetsp:Transcript_20054/g.56681  ORF Transcript_20054/g.56681 Transcript_20054/m.56681 type:complete len:99 (+) Transcript_20054:437-733(+)